MTDEEFEQLKEKADNEIDNNNSKIRFYLDLTSEEISFICGIIIIGYHSDLLCVYKMKPTAWKVIHLLVDQLNTIEMPNLAELITLGIDGKIILGK